MLSSTFYIVSAGLLGCLLSPAHSFDGVQACLIIGRMNSLRARSCSSMPGRFEAAALCGSLTLLRSRGTQAIRRPFHYAIIDEADSVLIDDCRNPLIISSVPDPVSRDSFVAAHKVPCCLPCCHAGLWSWLFLAITRLSRRKSFSAKCLPCHV